MGLHVEVTHGVIREPRTDAPRKKSAIGKGNEKFRISFIKVVIILWLHLSPPSIAVVHRRSRPAHLLRACRASTAP